MYRNIQCEFLTRMLKEEMKSEKKWKNKSEKVLEIIFKYMNAWVKGSEYQLKVGVICGDCLGGIRICAWNTEKRV